MKEKEEKSWGIRNNAQCKMHSLTNDDVSENKQTPVFTMANQSHD